MWRVVACAPLPVRRKRVTTSAGSLRPSSSTPLPPRGQRCPHGRRDERHGWDQVRSRDGVGDADGVIPPSRLLCVLVTRGSYEPASDGRVGTINTHQCGSTASLRLRCAQKNAHRTSPHSVSRTPPVTFNRRMNCGCCTKLSSDPSSAPSGPTCRRPAVAPRRNAAAENRVHDSSARGRGSPQAASTSSP